MKNCILALVFITISTAAFSQVSISPGVRAGVNSSNLTNTSLDDKTDFYLGAFAAIKLVHFYTLQPELNYSRQGAESKFLGSDDLEIQYLGISIANKFHPFKEISLSAIVGPAINIKVGDNFDNNWNEDIEDFDFLIFGGLAYDFTFGLSVEARYYLGIVDIFGRNINNDFNEDTNFDHLRLNTIFQIGATYKFDF